MKVRKKRHVFHEKPVTFRTDPLVIFPLFVSVPFVSCCDLYVNTSNAAGEVEEWLCDIFGLVWTLQKERWEKKNDRLKGWSRCMRSLLCMVWNKKKDAIKKSFTSGVNVATQLLLLIIIMHSFFCVCLRKSRKHTPLELNVHRVERVWSFSRMALQKKKKKKPTGSFVALISLSGFNWG